MRSVNTSSDDYETVTGQIRLRQATGVQVMNVMKLYRPTYRSGTETRRRIETFKQRQFIAELERLLIDGARQLPNTGKLSLAGQWSEAGVGPILQSNQQRGEVLSVEGKPQITTMDLKHKENKGLDRAAQNKRKILRADRADRSVSTTW